MSVDSASSLLLIYRSASCKIFRFVCRSHRCTGECEHFDTIDGALVERLQIECIRYVVNVHPGLALETVPCMFHKTDHFFKVHFCQLDCLRIKMTPHSPQPQRLRCIQTFLQKSATSSGKVVLLIGISHFSRSEATCSLKARIILGRSPARAKCSIISPLST
jgi:hypothetical protein